MAYNSFKRLEQLRDILGLQELNRAWLPTPKHLPQVSDLLMVAMQEAQEESLITEKAKSEYVVVPVLKELRRQNRNKFSTFSGFEFNVDKTIGLSGYCDFILSAEVQRVEIASPIFCIVEAKDGEIDKGFGQCGAEMFAARLFNERKGTPRPVIYGCVTNAFSWCFLKLEGQNLYIDPNYVPLTFAEPHRVLGALQWVLDQSLGAV
jgi:hypothetical protein